MQIQICTDPNYDSNSHGGCGAKIIKQIFKVWVSQDFLVFVDFMNQTHVEMEMFKNNKKLIESLISQIPLRKEKRIFQQNNFSLFIRGL